ncbi:MAG: alkaline phosphatase family protein [Anaerolineae bacterium]
MLKRIAALAIIPLILTVLGYGAQKLTLYSWNQVVEYQSPYTVPLPLSSEGQPVADQVVIVVVDGLRLDASREMPTLNRLRAQGADLVAITGEPSLSLPGWTVIASGAYQEISGVTTNWYEGAVKVDHIFAAAKRKGLTTAIVGGPDWGQLFGPQVDYSHYIKGAADERDVPAVRRADKEILDVSLAILREQKPNLFLIHFHGPDSIGHGYGGASPEYREDAQHIDRLLAQLVEAVDLNSAVLLVTADHGQIDTGGHGGWEPVVKRVPLIIAGKGIVSGATYGQVGQGAIASTVAVLLGTSIPTHSQDGALLGLIEEPAQARGQQELAVAQQLATFYDGYARQVGAAPFGQELLASAKGDLLAGDLAAYTSFVQEITQRARAARAARLGRERLGRLPLALAVAIVPALYVVFHRRKREWLLPLVGAAFYFVIYNGLFFGRGLQWSLSVYNTEAQIETFFTQRAMDAMLAIVIAALVVGLLSRGRTRYEAAKMVVNTSFLVGYLLLLQIALFYWLYDVRFSWYIPDLKIGFKYYLDLLQMMATSFPQKIPLAFILPFLGLGAQWVAQRVPVGR